MDRKLLTSCVKWILKHQTADGAFEESLDYYDFPLDRRLLNKRQVRYQLFLSNSNISIFLNPDDLGQQYYSNGRSHQSCLNCIDQMR